METLGLERADLRLDEIKAAGHRASMRTVSLRYEQAERDVRRRRSSRHRQQLDDAAENALIISQATLNSSQLYAQQEDAQRREHSLTTLESLLDSAKAKQQAVGPSQEQQVRRSNALQHASWRRSRNSRMSMMQIIAENDKKIEELRKAT